MDLEGIMCQAKKDRYYKISLTRGISKKGGWNPTSLKQRSDLQSPEERGGVGGTE